MSALWVAVLVVGALTLLFRLLPVVAVGRTGLSQRAADGLRHAGSGAVAALVVLAVLGPAGSLRPQPPVLAAVVAGALLARRGWSMPRVVLAGGCVYAGVALAVGLVA